MRYLLAQGFTRFIEFGPGSALNGFLRRIDKSARALKIGDRLVFAMGGRLTAVTVTGLGERRGPAVEARSLYAPLADGRPAALPPEPGAPSLGSGFGEDAR